MDVSKHFTIYDLRFCIVFNENANFNSLLILNSTCYFLFWPFLNTWQLEVLENKNSNKIGQQKWFRCDECNNSYIRCARAVVNVTSDDSNIFRSNLKSVNNLILIFFVL